MAGAAEVPRELDDLVVVDAALDDGVHLDAEPGGGGGGDPVEHPADREADVVHGAERLVVERVEADRDALQAGRDERLGLLRQQRAVRRQGDVEAAERREALDQHLEIAAQERLAARDPDLLDAVRDERAARAARSPRTLSSSLRSMKR